MPQKRSSKLHLSEIAWYTADKVKSKIEVMGTLIGA